MDLKKTTTHLTLFLTILFAAVFSYAGNQENPLVKAIRLFDEGNYPEAEHALKVLLDAKPDHLMINYYYGACRTENRHYGTNEVIYLLNGSTGESPLKTDYYLGVQYHAKNRWDEALKHYTRFKGKSTQKQNNEVQISEKIQQCYEKINPFVNNEDKVAIDVLPAAVPREKEIEIYNPIITSDSIVIDTIVDSIEIEETDSVELETFTETPVILEKTIPKAEAINFIIDGELTYLDSTNFRTEAGLKYYTEGNLNQKELVKRLTEVDELRLKYGASNSYSEKQEIGEKILTAETDNYKLQSETKELLMLAKKTEIEYWQKVSDSEKNAFIKKLEEEMQAKHKIEAIELEVDTTTYINLNELYTEPETLTQEEKNGEDELIYKIQLGAYSRGLPSYVENLFKKLSYLRKIENYTDKRGIVVYTTGNLTNYDDALKMQHQVRQEGVEDAFVVPYYNGKRITLKEAKEIESVK